MWQWHQMGFPGWLMMIAFWIIVFVLIIWTIRTATSIQQKTADTALRILDERLSRGDIEPEEYEERRLLLISRK